MKKFTVICSALCVALTMASPALAGDFGKSGDSVTIADARVQTCRNVLTGEKYDPNQPVYAFFHGNRWGMDGPDFNTVELQNQGGVWTAPGMVGIVFNIGQYSNEPHPSKGPNHPDNRKWPVLQDGEPGVIRMDGNLCILVK